MKRIAHRAIHHSLLALALISTLAQAAPYGDNPEELLLISDDSEELLLLDDSGSLEIGDEEDLLLLPNATLDAEAMETKDAGSGAAHASGPMLKIDSVWVEFGHHIDADPAAKNQAYVHGKASLDWADSSRWEFKVGARLDGYANSGGANSDVLKLDYDETYIRYRATNAIFTVGAQKIIWGRIDEFPPTDRLSTQDLRRFIIDNLEDRRLASTAIRYEHFFDAGKMDLVIYPVFREAELAEPGSNWYPVNKQKGTIFGLKTNAAIEALVRVTPIKEQAPSSEGGFGMRFSSLGSALDIGLTLQQGRQSIPYFSYNPATNTVEGRFPRTSIIAGDIGFEALGGTLKFETAWLSDTPATRTDGRYIEVNSLSWGAALELFPGDGDARLNLQLTGQSMLDEPAVLDRNNIYALNGSYEIPFAAQNWRAKTRFNLGLDEKDIYLNPEIAFIGWNAQEAYIEIHYFDGNKGTPGGFHKDNSQISVGWRGSF